MARTPWRVSGGTYVRERGGCAAFVDRRPTWVSWIVRAASGRVADKGFADTLTAAKRLASAALTRAVAEG